MQNKKENFLEKIVKKNYNNELEIVLEKKYFEENTKNILLTILYKLEASYKDYETVKKNVMPKDDFLKLIVDTIKNDCDTIKIIKMNSEEKDILGTKTFLVDKKNKSIISYPIERKVLYCISKISKRDTIIKEKYFVINKTLSDLINIGNNINSVEPLRDFNGFSWTTVPKEIESITHNLIYQNLRILLGHGFLNKWIYNNEVMLDYYEKFKNALDKEYGTEISEKIVKTICELSIFLEMKFDKIEAGKLKREKQEVDQKLKEIKDREDFIKQKTKEKKELNKKIKNIDETINDKKMLQEEYIQRNELLPLDKKIFSMKILKKMMLGEKEKLMQEIEELNNLLNPHKFIEYKEKLEKKYRYLKLTNCRDIEGKIDKLKLELQNQFLKCIEIKIENANESKEISDLMYEFRYYLVMPYNENENVYEEPKLKEQLDSISKKLIDKAIENKDILKISKNEELNYKILKNIFATRIIDLKDIYVRLVKDKEKIYIQFLDDNVFEGKIELDNIENINLKELNVKLNKNTKLFLA